MPMVNNSISHNILFPEKSNRHNRPSHYIDPAKLRKLVIIAKLIKHLPSLRGVRQVHDNNCHRLVKPLPGFGKLFATMRDSQLPGKTTELKRPISKLSREDSGLGSAARSPQVFPFAINREVPIITLKESKAFAKPRNDIGGELFGIEFREKRIVVR